MTPFSSIPISPICRFKNKKLYEIYADFRREYLAEGNLCACKALTYEGGKIPDYENPIVQKYYFLRFLHAYLAEYYLLYKGILKQNFVDGELRVLSIGCGCGIDLWGLYFALLEIDKKATIRIDYTGIDLIDWQYKDDLKLKKIKYIKKDINKLKMFNANDFNVIVFPKSIGEFPPDSFDRLCEKIKTSVFNEDRIYAICSLMDLGKKDDMARFERIALIMQEQQGYKCLDNLELYSTYDHIKGISNLINGYEYPDEILQQLCQLSESCPTYTINAKKSCKITCQQLNRFPILTAKYMNYQILRFERSQLKKESI